MTDKRIVKTKESFYKALGELLTEKSFEEITVIDIAKKAHKTRKTFYNHYQDKIELVNSYQKELSQKILDLQHHFTSLNDRQYFIQLIDLLSKENILLPQLLSYNGSLELQSLIKATMINYCKQILKKKNLKGDFLNYQAIYMANGIFGILQHWLNNDQKYSPNEYAEIFLTIINENL